MREHYIYNQIFKIDDSLKLADIHKQVQSHVEVKRHSITLTPALSGRERELNVALLLNHSICIFTDHFLPPSKKITTGQESPNIVIFNNYLPINESYYQERPEDVCFIETLKISNLWVYGDSGKGKTVLITRNLIKNKKEYLFCDLSPFTITKSKDIFGSSDFCVIN